MPYFCRFQSYKQDEMAEYHRFADLLTRISWRKSLPGDISKKGQS